MPAVDARPNNGAERGSALLSLILLAAAVGLLIWALQPAIDHYRKRQQFQTISQFTVPIQGAVEKCLAIKRDIRACDSLDKLVPHGYRRVDLKLESLIDEVLLEADDERFTLTTYPADQPELAPFLDESLTYILHATVVERDARAVIEHWELDPNAGCALAGLC